MGAELAVLSPPPWNDYELLDTGNSKKWERFGAYTLVRPETQAIWSPGRPAHEWEQADAFFERGGSDEGTGQWNQHCPIPEQWLLHHDEMRFWARLTPFRHTGIFPEHSVWWPWITRQLRLVQHRKPEVLVLFGYTGLATLVAARAGARVCHVDASRPAIRWARDNQEASGLVDYPIRWIADDVLKFVRREQRRGSRYDLIMMDPPVFGRGPKGEVWRLHESLPTLVADCTRILHEQPAGFLINAYATTFSSLTLLTVLNQAMRPYAEGGSVAAGELVLSDTSAGHTLSCGLYASWSAKG